MNIVQILRLLSLSALVQSFPHIERVKRDEVGNNVLTTTNLTSLKARGQDIPDVIRVEIIMNGRPLPSPENYFLSAIDEIVGLSDKSFTARIDNYDSGPGLVRVRGGPYYVVAFAIWGIQRAMEILYEENNYRAVLCKQLVRQTIIGHIYVGSITGEGDRADESEVALPNNNDPRDAAAMDALVASLNSVPAHELSRRNTEIFWVMWPTQGGVGFRGVSILLAVLRAQVVFAKTDVSKSIVEETVTDEELGIRIQCFVIGPESAQIHISYLMDRLGYIVTHMQETNQYQEWEGYWYTKDEESGYLQTQAKLVISEVIASTPPGVAA